MREELVELIYDKGVVEIVNTCDEPCVEIDGKDVNVVSRMAPASITTLDQLAEALVAEAVYLGADHVFIRSVETHMCSGEQCFRVRYAIA